MTEDIIEGTLAKKKALKNLASYINQHRDDLTISKTAEKDGRLNSDFSFPMTITDKSSAIAHTDTIYKKICLIYGHARAPKAQKGGFTIHDDFIVRELTLAGVRTDQERTLQASIIEASHAATIATSRPSKPGNIRQKASGNFILS